MTAIKVLVLAFVVVASGGCGGSKKPPTTAGSGVTPNGQDEKAARKTDGTKPDTQPGDTTATEEDPCAVPPPH